MRSGLAPPSPEAALAMAARARERLSALIAAVPPSWMRATRNDFPETGAAAMRCE